MDDLQIWGREADREQVRAAVLAGMMILHARLSADGLAACEHDGPPLPTGAVALTLDEPDGREDRDLVNCQGCREWLSA